MAPERGEARCASALTELLLKVMRGSNESGHLSCFVLAVGVELTIHILEENVGLYAMPLDAGVRSRTLGSDRVAPRCSGAIDGAVEKLTADHIAVYERVG
jgi:hypothetical protein